MNEIQIKELVDTNFRILLLLGYAASIAMSYNELTVCHDDKKKCRWLFDAIDNVIYKNKPLPEMP